MRSVKKLLGLLLVMILIWILKPTTKEVETVYKYDTIVKTEVKTEYIIEYVEKPVVIELDAKQYIWAKLRQYFPSPVVAGIMGNIAAECSYNANLWDDSHCYYGICQWNKWDYQEVLDTDLDTQLDYLLATIEAELRYSETNYSAFLELTDEQEVALAFAQGYERCASYTYTTRQAYASDIIDEMADIDAILQQIPNIEVQLSEQID